MITTTSVKHRKITLYNGEEKFSSLSIPSADSNSRALQIVSSELSRNPILTHALFSDRAGKEWIITREQNFIQRLIIALRAA
jgi:hypothetical protein